MDPQILLKSHFLQDHSDPKTQKLNFQFSKSLPPHVSSNQAKLLGYAIQIEVTEGTVITPTSTPFVTYAITKSETPSFTLDENNFYSYFYTAPLKVNINDMIVNETLSFDLTNIPAFLKGTNGFIDPSVIKNIVLVLYYQGAISWGASKT
jgi:hypothetical protein